MVAQRVVVRRAVAGLDPYGLALFRAGFERVAGVDEAGRGACAGPLAVAACVLESGPRGRIAGLADSKALSQQARETLFEEIVARAAAYSIVLIPSVQIDSHGLHVMNIEGMRRAVAGLAIRPDYVVTDGFPVAGFGVPTTAVWKGDAVVGAISAASILAKVTRDRFMLMLARQYPQYAFESHKGYATAEHMTALAGHGPCPQHRFSYANVRRFTTIR